MSELKLQSERVTQEMFDRMPALMTAFQVKLVTGWDDHELGDAVREERIEVWKRPVRKGRTRSYRKYLKVSVAKLTGFKV